MIRALALTGALCPMTALAAPTATIAPFGIGVDGQMVQVVTLRNDRGMTVRFSTRGGAIMELSTPDRAGRTANLVLGKPDFAAWESAGSFNSVVGRYANRIGGGGFVLDGVRYDLAGANRETKVVLHGGPSGFASKVWATSLFTRGGRAGATLTLVSPDGENGFPGTLTVRMSYTLDNANVLRIAYDASTDRPTVVNLTNHSYFNLAGGTSGTVYGQLLTLHASHYTPTDARQIPTGQVAPVAGTPFDFRRPARIGDRVRSHHPQVKLARGIDHNFVIDGRGLRLAAQLVDPVSGRCLNIRTTEPGMQVYTANHFNGTTLGEGGRPVGQGDGIAFETQHFPDSPNQPDFPSTTLRPGETFRSITEFAFSLERKPRR